MQRLALSLFNPTKKLTHPQYYTNISEALASSALLPKDNELIYFSVGSFNKAHASDDCGYAQALPLFIENYLRSNKNIKIILCDSWWTKNNFDDSDLARYLKENRLTKYRKQFFCVEKWLNRTDFPRLIAYFSLILQKKGTIFLAEFEGPGLMDVYSDLLLKTNTEKFLNRLYYFEWDILHVKTSTGNITKVAAQIWAGEPFKKIDCALFQLQTQHLYWLFSSLAGNEIESQQDSIRRFHAKNPSPLTAKDQQKLLELNTELEERKKERGQLQEMLAVPSKSYMPFVLNAFAKTLNINNYLLRSLDVSEKEFELIKQDIINPTKKLACQIGCLIPTNHLPLIEFRGTEMSDGAFAVELILPERNVLDLFARDIMLDFLTPTQNEVKAMGHNNNSLPHKKA